MGDSPDNKAETGVAKIGEIKKYLIIGCGNTLRGDDGLGSHVIKGLQDMQGPFGADAHICIMAVPQLDIILAPKISEADAIIFVDARIDESEEFVRIERIEPTSGPLILQHTSHAITMPVLLRITLDWYGAAPVCYAVMPKGYDFSIGEFISERARIAAAQAGNKIREIVLYGIDIRNQEAGARS